MVLHIKAILDHLGLDFGGSWARPCGTWGPTWLRLGAQERSRAAQEHPRAAQERPRGAQERPTAAQDSTRQAKSIPRAPKTAQEQPRTHPGVAQDLPDPLQIPRFTHDLKSTPNFTTQALRTSFQTTKRPASKTSGGGAHPKGIFNPPDHLGESWACSRHT